jgi:phosphonate transport system substrate-binding protein
MQIVKDMTRGASAHTNGLKFSLFKDVKAMKWKSLLPMGAAIFALASALPAKAEITLAFGVYASDKPSAMVRQFRPILNALEKSLSELAGEPVRIRMQIAKTYEQGVIDLVAGKVDFARFGPASYIRAREADPRVEILAAESNKGKKTFNGVITVAEDSPITTVSELSGKSFAFGDERSTIGRYLSQLHLMRNNVRASDLKHFEYLGRHDAVGAAVGAGRFDAGALKESTFKRLLKKGIQLRAIARFPNVTKPWIARGGLTQKTKDMLRRTLLALKDPRALKALKKAGFLEGSDEDYAGIRDSILNNHLFFRKARKETAERK